MSRDTSPMGLRQVANKQNASLADQKAGSSLEASGTHSNVPNAAEPGLNTIANNQVNSHRNTGPMTGWTGDTGRKQP